MVDSVEEDLLPVVNIKGIYILFSPYSTNKSPSVLQTGPLEGHTFFFFFPEQKKERKFKAHPGWTFSLCYWKFCTFLPFAKSPQKTIVHSQFSICNRASQVCQALDFFAHCNWPAVQSWESQQGVNFLSSCLSIHNYFCHFSHVRPRCSFQERLSENVMSPHSLSEFHNTTKCVWIEFISTCGPTICRWTSSFLR